MAKIRVRILNLDGSEIVRDVDEVQTQGQVILLFEMRSGKSELDPIQRKKMVAGYWNVVGFEIEDIDDAGGD